MPHLKQGQLHPRKGDPFLLWEPRQHLLVASEPDHQPYDCRAKEGHGNDPLAAPFDLSFNPWVAAGDQAGACAGHLDPVVANEPCEGSGGSGGLDQGNGQAALAGS